VNTEHIVLAFGHGGSPVGWYMQGGEIACEGLKSCVKYFNALSDNKYQSGVLRSSKRYSSLR